MLRSKGLSEKVLLLGVDGLDPKFTRVMVDEGHMPNTKKLIERGSARHDLKLLGGVPTSPRRCGPRWPRALTP